MAQPPAFQFYASDFRADANVSAMTLEEVGAYTLLLTFCWTEGSIPTDRKALTRLLKIDHRTLDRIWPAIAPCFTVKGDSYVQGRMERERAKQAQFREQAAASGRRGAGKRWGGHSNPTPTLPTGDDKPTETPLKIPTGLDDSPSPSPSPSPSSIVGASHLPARVGAKQPLQGYRRLRVFPWMVDEILGMLGDHAEAFDLDAWLIRLDSSGEVLPADLWPWMKTEVSQAAAAKGFRPSTRSDGHTDLDAVRALLRRDGVIE